ncbi:hypothetical protein NOVOSPHI9U_10160 [Novosphingobium sp. 9U]|nr:hypothetical protein NOVOSPHI9U_10160 [Novosphingobium sp. 9U]
MWSERGVGRGRSLLKSQGLRVSALNIKPAVPAWAQRVFVGSTKVYPIPDLGVGGSGSPRTTVRSTPVRPPRGPICSYWPDLGAEVPGGSVVFFMLVSLIATGPTYSGLFVATAGNTITDQLTREARVFSTCSCREALRHAPWLRFARLLARAAEPFATRLTWKHVAGSTIGKRCGRNKVVATQAVPKPPWR